MSYFLRSTLALIVAVSVAVAIATLPTRAADESKALQDRVDKLEKKVKKLEAKLKYTRIVKNPINGLAGPHVLFEGCNVHVRSGSGNTTDGTVDLANQESIPGTTPVGLGNLVVGYNEQPSYTNYGRGGSHNLVVGPWHEYTNVGGATFGQENSAKGPLASVVGGYQNNANGYAASVSGGYLNGANGETATIGGGSYNVAGGISSSVSGGFDNTATGNGATVSGGASRTASGASDWVAGALFQDN